MKAARFIWFIIMIAAGIAIGLYYTWIVNPVKFIDATFFDLRQDYKADYVLMVAEIYNKNANLLQTMMRIDRLLEESPEKAVENAIVNAGQLGFSETDVDMLYHLNDAIGGKTIEPVLQKELLLDFAEPPGEGAEITPSMTAAPEEVNPFDAPPVGNTLVPVYTAVPDGGG